MPLLVAILVFGLFFFALVSMKSTLKQGTRNSQILTTPDGAPYLWSYSPPTRNSSAVSKIGVTAEVPFDFTLDREGKGEKLAKWMGFSSEFQTGDTAFDDLVYIDCEFPPFCEKLRDSQELRRQVSGLLETQATSLTLEKGKLFATLSIASEAIDPQMAQAIVESLNGIVRLLPEPSTYPDYVRPPFSRAQLATWMIIGLLGLGAILSFINAVQPYHTVAMSALIAMTAGCAVGAIGVILFIIVLVFHGSPRGYDVIASFIRFGLAGTFLCTLSVVSNLNVHLDTSAAEIHDQRIVSKTITYGRRSSKYYHVHVEDWHAQGGTYDLSVNSVAYSQAMEGQYMRLFTHPGYLGMEWIERYQFTRGTE